MCWDAIASFGVTIGATKKINMNYIVALDGHESMLYNTTTNEIGGNDGAKYGEEV
jgi:hypothetical protein